MSEVSESSTPVVEQPSTESVVSEQPVNESIEAKEAAIDADPNLSKEEKKEAKKLINKLRIKVDGQEFDEELPFDIEEGDTKTIQFLQKQMQLAKMSHKRAQESAGLRNAFNQIVQELKTNPRKILSDPNIGVDLKKLAADVLNEEIERSNLTPEELKMKEMEAELQKLKEEREAENEALRQKELARMQEQEFERYDMLFTKALDKTDLPKSPYVVKKMADYMLLGLQNGYDLTPEQVVPLVREEIQGDIRSMFGAMPDEVLENFIDKGFIDRIRKKNVAKAKESTPPIPLKSSIKDVVKPDSTKKNDAPKKSYKDFFGV